MFIAGLHRAALHAHRFAFVASLVAAFAAYTFTATTANACRLFGLDPALAVPAGKAAARSA